MANPIKETPTLYGKDARRFAEAIANPKPLPQDFIDGIHRRFGEFERALERGRIAREKKEREALLQVEYFSPYLRNRFESIN
jgi:hypothetical protein